MFLFHPFPKQAGTLTPLSSTQTLPHSLFHSFTESVTPQKLFLPCYPSTEPHFFSHFSKPPYIHLFLHTTPSHLNLISARHTTSQPSPTTCQPTLSQKNSANQSDPVVVRLAFQQYFKLKLFRMCSLVFALPATKLQTNSMHGIILKILNS